MGSDFSSWPSYSADPEPEAEAERPDRFLLAERKARDLWHFRVRVGTALGVLAIYLLSLLTMLWKVNWSLNFEVVLLIWVHLICPLSWANPVFLLGCLSLARGKETAAACLGAVAVFLAIPGLATWPESDGGPLGMNSWMWLGRIGLLIPASVLVKHMRPPAEG